MVGRSQSASRRRSSTRMTTTGLRRTHLSRQSAIPLSAWSILDDLRKTQSAVVAGWVINWGAELENSFSLVVFLTLNAEIRVARLRVRELAMFGQIDPEFLEWAGQYEEGRLPGRSRERHEQWLSERSCPVLRLDGNLSVDERLTRVVQAISNCS